MDHWNASSAITNHVFFAMYTVHVILSMAVYNIHDEWPGTMGDHSTFGCMLQI